MPEAHYDREELARVVRAAWVRWAKTHPDPRPSWLAPYDELSDLDREADRQIGAAVAEAVLARLNERRLSLIERKFADGQGHGLSGVQEAELAALQAGTFDALAVMFPPPALAEEEEAVRKLTARVTGEDAP